MTALAAMEASHDVQAAIIATRNFISRSSTPRTIPFAGLSGCDHTILAQYSGRHRRSRWFENLPNHAAARAIAEGDAAAPPAAMQQVLGYTVQAGEEVRKDARILWKTGTQRKTQKEAPVVT